MKDRIIELVNSIAVMVLFLSLGMYDSENIVIPAIISLISGGWVLLVTNRMEHEHERRRHD